MLKKTFLATTGTIGLFALILSLPQSALASTKAPTISIKKYKDTTLTLKLTSTDLKKKSVKIKVRINNEDTDTVETRTFETTLDKSGKTTLTIDNLVKGAEYTIKSAIRKSTSEDYSDYSNEISLNATGIKDYDIKISTKDIASDSIKLKITSIALKKKTVNIKVRVTNEDTSDVSTQVFKKTLDKKGSAYITLTGLSSDTEYSMKATIKKTSNTAYSSFSDKKSATTEE